MVMRREGYGTAGRSRKLMAGCFPRRRGVSCNGASAGCLDPDRVLVVLQVWPLEGSKQLWPSKARASLLLLFLFS